ncbi:MAG: nitronate monooxygenase family protein, partial [Defluviitaleaceae bacterium]|nr:nitronate monooxygenase family protein [Defluviitaleaceae bacterium]
MITNLLNIKYPMIQGGMANISNGVFAGKMSNEGILGSIGSAAMNAEQLEKEILDAKNTTDNPFAVNIMLMNPHCDELVEVVIKQKVKVVTTGAGNPEKYMEKLKSAGVIVIPVVPSVSLAKRVERSGADAIVVEGTEAGGHIGELTTMAIVPQVVDSVNIPVIAAGGIADARQVLAAFALGASGVQAGTIFLASIECPIHQNYKESLIKAKDTDTVVTGRITGVPVRIIKNKMARTYISMEKQGKTKEDLEHFTLGSLRKAVFDGNVDDGSVMAG